MPSKFFGHLHTVLTHKRYVAHYCFLCGLYKQGIIHDLSKFSPTEFFESVRYYQGTRSPIDACKEKNGYSLAWFHHRGRNRHHWEYWVDDFQQGMIPKKMPFRFALEMFCDYLGAGRAYNGKGFTIEDEYKWWEMKRKHVVMHKDTLQFIDAMFSEMWQRGIESVLKDKHFIMTMKKEYEK